MPSPTLTNTPTPAPSDTPTLVVQPDTPTPEPLPTDTPEPLPSDTPTTVNTPTHVPIPPTNTPHPTPTETPTTTPTPEPVIKYVLAGTAREFNCEYTAIYGSVKNANNFGIPGVQVRALGIKGTGGDFVAVTDGDGNYEAFRIPLEQLLAGQWAVMVVEDGREISERFHWASTPVCQSDDTGHSQHLRVDWKLIE